MAAAAVVVPTFGDDQKQHWYPIIVPHTGTKLQYLTLVPFVGTKLEDPNEVPNLDISG